MKQKLVVLTGAGISAESGIPTFRSSDGLWENYKIEEVASPEGWNKNPELVLEFYNQRRKKVKAAQPNDAHKILVDLEQNFDVQIITQNIDDLHERAGSKKVLHLHGEIFKKRCTVNSDNIQEINEDLLLSNSPDGGHWRPHIVWFGEEVPMLDIAIQWTEQADIFLIIGTSLTVYPAASLYEFAPRNAEIWLIDHKIPNFLPQRVNTIELPASLGLRKWISNKMSI